MIPPYSPPLILGGVGGVETCQPSTARSRRQVGGVWGGSFLFESSPLPPSFEASKADRVVWNVESVNITLSART